MLKRPEVKESRFASLVRLAGRAEEDEAPPPGLETRLVAFAEGAVAGRARPRLWKLAPIAVGLAAAAIGGWLLLDRAPSERADAPRPGTRSPPLPTASAPTPSPVQPSPLVSTSPVGAALLEAPDWRTRRAAAENLGARPLGVADGVQLGRALAEDPNWRVREAVLDVLRRRPGLEAARALAQATEDPHLGIRTAALAAVSERLSLGAPVTDALLRRLDRDPDWRIRDAALTALLRSAEGERAAAMALADRHRRLRQRARDALVARR
jgi:hypothetical protein